MPAETVKLLREIPLFRQLGLAELYLLAGIGTEETVPAGTVLGVEDEPLADLWVILEGRVAVSSPATGTAVSYLDAPQVWGSAAIVEPYTSFGTATAAIDCRMLRIPSVDLRELASRNPRLGARLYEEFASSIFVRLHRLIEEARARAGASPAGEVATAPASPPLRTAGAAGHRRDVPELYEAPSDALALLQQVPLLRHLAPDQLRLLFAIGVERNLPPGTLLGRGGGPLDVVWVILHGEVSIDSPLTRGATTLAGPDVWGAAALVPPFTPNGTATTQTECRTLLLRASDVRQLIEQSPRLGVDLYLALSTHIFRRIRLLTKATSRPPA